MNSQWAVKWAKPVSFEDRSGPSPPNPGPGPARSASRSRADGQVRDRNDKPFNLPPWFCPEKDGLEGVFEDWSPHALREQNLGGPSDVFIMSDFY